MKKSLFFMSAIAALVMTGCSSEEPAPGPNEGGSAEGNSYMAITISNLSVGSRAATVGEPEFENAATGSTEGKITAENLYFFFFDKNGNAFPLVYEQVNGAEVVTNMVKPLAAEFEAGTSEGDGKDQTVTGILVLGKPGQGYVGEVPAQVLCVANPYTDVMKNLENKTLASVLATPATPPASWNGKTTNFVMTSASYIKDGALKVTDDVTPHIYGSPEAAKADPVQINIERLAAKVRVTYAASYPVQKKTTNDEGAEVVENPGKFTIDNVADQELEVVINGWQLYNTATQANAFKQLNADYTFNPTWVWNDPTNKRSYWAESNPGATLRKTDWDLYNDAHFTNKSFNAATPVENVVYCYENTKFPGIAATDRTVNKATGIVIKATVRKKGETAGINLMRWNGAYYTLAALKDKAAKQWSANNSNAAYDVANVEFVQDAGKNTYHAVYHISQDNTQVITLFTNILWWKDGVTSYYTNVEHLGGLFGVVRNHIYDYVIDGLIGLGIPGNKPDVPEETQHYVACHVRVLNWHVVKNNVTLE